MGNFYSFLCLSSRIFRRSDDFIANFRENSQVVGVHNCAVGVPADAITVGVGRYTVVKGRWGGGGYGWGEGRGGCV
jgi:hypothetical protein